MQDDAFMSLESQNTNISEHWWRDDSDYEKLYQNKHLSTESIYWNDSLKLRQSFIIEETRVNSSPINSEFYEWWSNQPEISEDDSREINDTINTYFNYSQEKSPNQNVTSKNSLSEANCAIEENSLNGENWELSLLNPIEGNQDKVSDEILESDQIQEVLEESKLTSLHVRSKKVDFSKVFFHIKMFIVEEAYKLKYLKDRYGRQPDSDKIVEYPKKPGRKWHQISWDKNILRDKMLLFLNSLIEREIREKMQDLLLQELWLKISLTNSSRICLKYLLTKRNLKQQSTRT